MICIVIFPGFQLLDVSGPIAVFEIAARLVPNALDVRVVALRAGLVCSSSGVEMVAGDLQAIDAPATLIVSGGEGVAEAMRCPATLALVRAVAGRSGRSASVCSGAFLLAEAGLLKGRRATTHWSLTTSFSARYPDVKIMPDRIFTRDGPVWTSAGISAGIDLALALVADDHGAEVSRDVARHLVLSLRRGGGQSQFSSLLELEQPTGKFSGLLSWIRRNIHLRLTMEDLAAQVGMSPRHFTRVFAKEMGITPSKAVEKLRVEVAREKLDSSGEPVECIAQEVGFSDPERMRRAFIRTFGHPPQSLRRAARELDFGR